MPHLPLYWIMLADAHGARLLQGTRPFTELEAVDGGFVPPPRNHHFSREIGTDQPGRAYSTADGRRAAIEPAEDPLRAEERAFAEDLAKQLNDAARAGRYDRLIIAAPPTMLGDIRNVLGASARARLNATLNKDLVQVPTEELSPRLLAAIGF
ncbi:host attachment protein [Zavarzinia compransoris]|uniref:host attachment protein n=1 Tax=Zavarzinia marina TaxID=2911065 RepID=UPI001F29CAEF|nr:host attachment protein [Zavarzinia marina]MCF4166616.1 host attachment protein [Zavarzinia marina]